VGFLALLPTSPRYKQFGTKLSPLFGFAKSSKYKSIFQLSLIPKLLVACVGGWLFCRNYEFPQSFHAFTFQIPILGATLFKFLLFTLPLASSNFHTFAFQFSILGAILFKFPLFTLPLANSNFHVSTFLFSIFMRNIF
jgi:hypothetical protein